MTNLVISTKKSALKVGTESLSNFKDILFKDAELFFVDRGLVMYARDGGNYENIRWENVHVDSFYPYADEKSTGTVFDFEVSHRSGYSQTANITAKGIEAPAITGSHFKGIAEAKLRDVRISDLVLRVQPPKTTGARPYLFACASDVEQVTIDGLRIDWGENEGLWSGVQQDASCVEIRHCDGCPPSPPPSDCVVSLARQVSESECSANTFGCFDGNASMFVAAGCRGDFICDGVLMSCPQEEPAGRRRGNWHSCECQQELRYTLI